jgi:hypothetical protein
MFQWTAEAIAAGNPPSPFYDVSCVCAVGGLTWRPGGAPDGLCACCWWANGPGAEPHRVPADYLWVTRGGHEWPLCVGCCAMWRAHARPDAHDTPARITQGGAMRG